MVARGAGMMPAAGAREYLPLKVNSAGVMPIIFAQTLMFLPATIYSFVTGTGQQGGTFSDVFGLWYNVVFFLLILVFTFVYTALMVNPTQHSDYLKRNNAFIPGVKPGESTTEFLDSIMTRITLPGAIALAFIGVLPALVAYFGVNQAFAHFFGGTTLLILVGVALDTLQVIESYLLMRKYDGLTKSGQIQGRMSSFQVTSDVQQ
jgi:preprotein translocase subunit SecY